MNHHVDHGNTYHGFTALNQRLIVFGKSSILTQPGKRSLNNPSPGKDDKLVRLGSFDDFNGPAVPPNRPIHKLPGITAIRPDDFKASPSRTQLLDQQLAAVTVLDVGRVNDQREDQAERVNDDMALTPLGFLARIVPSVAPFSAVLTDWLSMMPALGVGLRPFSIRTRRRSCSWIFSHVPSSRKQR